MKNICLILLTFIAGAASAQDRSRSAPINVHITSGPVVPANIVLVANSLTFIDNDGNNAIDANETAYIRFEIKNTGKGEGIGLKATLNEQMNARDLHFPKAKELGNLGPNKTRRVEFLIGAGMKTEDKIAVFKIGVQEKNDFGMESAEIEVETRAFVPPVLKLVDSRFSAPNEKIEKKVPFTLQAIVQNLGQGKAEEVTTELVLPENIMCISDNHKDHYIGLLGPGEKEIINFELVATQNYATNTIPLGFSIKEKLGRYGWDTSLAASLDASVTSELLLVTAKTRETKEIKTASLGSHVDKNIPASSKKYPHRFALIIGNEKYSDVGMNAEIDVPYAVNDARIFKKYAQATLGVEEKNIRYSTNATYGTMRSHIDWITEVVKLEGAKAELFFFYAGHGYPDKDDKPFIMPVDANATNLGAAIPLDDVYRQLASSGAGKITVFLDACFSGGGRNQGMLAARGVLIKPKEASLTGNIVVFAASKGEQTSHPYHDEKHGLFTYFLLKKLQDTKANLTYGELSAYLNETVRKAALYKIEKKQEPQTLCSPAVADQWRSWTFK